MGKTQAVIMLFFVAALVLISVLYAVGSGLVEEPNSVMAFDDDGQSLISGGAAYDLVFEHVIVDETDYAYVRSIGDVDGNGFLDIIAAKSFSGLTWYRYPNWTKYSINSFNWRANDIECADVDEDGDVDVVGVQDDDGKVYWFENPKPAGNPTGTWQSHYIGSVGCYVKDLEVADFNNDGKLDIAARAESITAIFLQVTATSWDNIATLMHSGVDGLDGGDLDGDGDLDLVLNGFWMENPCPDLSETWVEHNIDSKWWNQSGDDWRDNNAKVFVTDINGDNSLDVVISQCEKPDYPVSWYESSDPKSEPWIEHVIDYFDYCHTLQAGDMDNDGDIDIVTGKFERDAPPLIPPPYPIRVYLNNNGDGLSWNFTEVSDVGIYTGVIGDIGNDGDLDIVGSRSYWKGPVEVWENKVNDFHVYPVYLFLTVEPRQSTYTAGQFLTVNVQVFGYSDPAMEHSLTLTITGPDNYYNYDFQKVDIIVDAVREYSFTWTVPDVAGTYVLEVELAPAQLTAYDAVWLKVVKTVNGFSPSILFWLHSISLWVCARICHYQE